MQNPEIENSDNQLRPLNVPEFIIQPLPMENEMKLSLVE